MNKIWNISRLIKLNIKTLEIDFDEELLLFPEKALLTHFSKLIKKIDSLYERYEFHIIGEMLYHFIWEEFGNFFLEFLKVFLKKEKEYLNTQKFLFFILKNILKLLHPFIPFVTDAIYEDLTLGKSIVHSSWPKIDYSDLKSLDDIQSLKTLIIQFRNWRHLHKINKNNLFTLYIEMISEKNKELNIFSSVLETFFQVNKVQIINSLDDNYVCLFSEKTYPFG
ncbi:class I tRNA ligase family protein [Candidatus Phytoplasma ziziphi]|uniref:class I tRNA ligase family protein n=1 Tax=Ziziphus jujuba witches'-broom phytoplasma TaxID=135727 RepID=UPI002A4E10DF|nr:class I tRNA ligase family protein [Candidatus Phytoplasma ziziphi]